MTVPASIACEAGHRTRSDATRRPARQLTKTPIAETQYTDTRLTWGATRCYAVRSVETVDALTVESEATPPSCVTLADTFPPAAPKGLQAVATEGVINLIWDPNAETDLDGYILLRAVSPGDELVADHAHADPRDDVSGSRAGRRAVRLRAQGGRQGRKHQRDRRSGSRKRRDKLESAI